MRKIKKTSSAIIVKPEYCLWQGAIDMAYDLKASKVRINNIKDIWGDIDLLRENGLVSVEETNTLNKIKEILLSMHLEGAQ